MSQMRQTSWYLRPALPLLLLAFFMLTMELTCTLAIPTNDSDSSNANSTNKTETINEEHANNTIPIKNMDNVALNNLSLREDYLESNNKTHIDDEEEELCHFVTKMIYPKSAESKSGEFVTVVQSSKHNQGYRVEVCENLERPCKFADAFPLGYTAACVQRYIYQSAVVLVNGELKEELLKLPSACKCVVKRNKF